MGILNVTPDSFHDGGRHFSPEAAVERALAMAEEGADFLDVGGESTRPGARPVPPAEEARRVVPVIAAIVRRTSVPVSVDTRNAAVAAEALDAGAVIVNDVSGLRHDPRMAGVVAGRWAAAVVMHMRGTPETMQEDTRYDDLVAEVAASLREGVRLAEEVGVAEILVDPGIGFGKSAAQNYAILARLREFAPPGRPLLAGVSRKSFIGSALGLPPSERLEGTIAAAVAAALNGAAVVRVHDVREVSRALRVADAVRAAVASPGDSWSSSG